MSCSNIAIKPGRILLDIHKMLLTFLLSAIAFSQYYCIYATGREIPKRVIFLQSVVGWTPRAWAAAERP